MKHWKWAVGVVLAAALCAGMWYGCTPTTASLVTPGKEVTRAEWADEVDMLVTRFNVRQDQLNAERADLNEKIAAGDAELTREELRNANAWNIGVEIAGSAFTFATQPGAKPAAMCGLGIIGALAAAWRVTKRRAKKGDAVGGVVVRAVDTIRKNPEMQGAFEAALKDALTRSGLSEAEYDRAIAKLKAGNVA